MTSKYQCEGRPALYLSSFEHRSLTFMIHRHEEGWTISQDGLRVQLMRENLKIKAISEFKRRVDDLIPSDHELRSLISRAKESNRVL